MNRKQFKDLYDKYEEELIIIDVTMKAEMKVTGRLNKEKINEKKNHLSKMRNLLNNWKRIEI